MLLALLTCATTGCVSGWYNAFLNPTELGNFRYNVINEIQQTISFEDQPAGIAGATEPTPDDLVATVGEYRAGPGDSLSVRMLDFLARDAETTFEPVLVDDLGYIDLPQMGLIHVEGLSGPELREELVQQAKDAGIYRPDSHPTVIVSFLQRQQRMYSIEGPNSVNFQSGRYPIPRPEFYLRDAINQAGGLGITIKMIYVFRGGSREKRIEESGLRRFAPGESQPLPEFPEPPVLPTELSWVAGAPNPVDGPDADAPEATPRPRNHGLALPAEGSQEELIDAVAPEGGEPVAPAAARTDSPRTVPAVPQPGSGPSLPPFIFVNDTFIEAPPGTPPQTGGDQASHAPETQPRAPSEPVDWQALAEDGRERIIRIPADRLRNGDSNYNIVIRHNDWISIDPGPVGTYYVWGHVIQPGAYPLSGENVTLTQAIATARGLDQLAWPTRCEIRRRLDGDREQITQWDLARIVEGKDPDLFIKANDIVNIGTHAIAPLLANIRNSFRLDYGFSFRYDRNFAEFDTLSGQFFRARAEQTQQGLQGGDLGLLGQ